MADMYIGQPEQQTTDTVARSWGVIGTSRVQIGVRIGFALSRAMPVQIRSRATHLSFSNAFSRKSKAY